MRNDPDALNREELKSDLDINHGIFAPYIDEYMK